MSVLLKKFIMMTLLKFIMMYYDDIVHHVIGHYSTDYVTTNPEDDIFPFI